MKTRRPWAWPLVPVYRGGLAVQEALRRAGVLQEHQLGWPVVSVGSLSAGGAGKTPVVMALAELLRARGWGVDVLSRGYGREGSGTALVLPGSEDAARIFGDEPVLIAQRTGATVWVGADRFAAGEAAECSAEAAGGLKERRARRTRGRSTEPLASDADEGSSGDEELDPAAGVPISRRRSLADPSSLQDDEPGETARDGVHLLDDGFQHRQLARSFDLVVVTAEDLDDALLPAGNLREPLSALRRADAIAVREDEEEAVSERLRPLAPERTPVWTVRRRLRFPQPLGVFGAGLRPLAFCALARPESFVASLRKSGCGVVDAVVFADHARYGEREVNDIVRLAGEARATGLVTTEKDAVKLSAEARALLEREVGPVVVVALDAEFVYSSPVLRTLEARLQRAVRELARRTAEEMR